MSNFKLYSKYYELLYNNKETEKECDYLLSLVKSFGVKSEKWIEFGAGSGRHGHIFKKKNVNWKGIEKSPEMIAIAHSNGLDISQFDISKPINFDESYDVTLSIFHVISYLTLNDHLIAAFNNAYNSLKVGGLFIFDVWYTPAVLIQKPESRVKNISNSEFEVSRKATPTVNLNSNTVNVHYEITAKSISDNKENRFNEDHLMRHFSIPEIDMLSAFTGFDFLHAEEWCTGHEPSSDTWGVVCVLRKKMS